jgi:release factor glutamine methyltransferase
VTQAPGAEPAPAVSALRDAVAAAEDALRAAGCDSPRLDAELLVADAAGLDRSALVTDPERGLAPSAARVAMESVRRRVAREPVAYILGRRGFRRLWLTVDRRALIPRPESELLVEITAELAPGRGRVHDVGTGCGAIALALADERPDLVVTASDASADAAALARDNAAALGLAVDVTVEPDLPRRIAEAADREEVDLVVANLPYVREADWSRLAPEITRYEPRAALVAGADGLDAIRALLAATPRGTLVALEHAPDQGAAVRAMLEGAETRPDLAGRERATVGRAR